jgi:ABC-type nickel/cobalt efflux system permease component RcnA
MGSPRRPNARLAILFFLLISSTQLSTAQDTYASNSDPTTIPEDAPGNTDNAEDIYGFGVRLGIYFQALAFLIGFFNVLRLDPKSQFSGVVIAFTVLVRWFTRLRAHNISAAELWVGLALLLLVSAPGMWLLFFTLEAQRRKWYRKMHDKRAAFAEVTKGQTLNILQALVIFLWTVVANSWFSYWIIAHGRGKGYPAAPGTKNVIWLGATTSVGSTWVKFFMIAQAALGTAFTAFPAFVYVCAVAFAIMSYWFPRGSTASPLLNTEDELDKRTRLETKRWAWTFGAALLLLCLALVLSVELTLKDAGLVPEMNVQRPGQLLPLIAGAVSCVSSAADAFGRRIPIHSTKKPTSGPFTVHRSRDEESGIYVPLEDVHSNKHNRTWAASGSTHDHGRVGSGVYADGHDEISMDSLPGYERHSGYGDGHGNLSRSDGRRNTAYEPYRRL